MTTVYGDRDALLRVIENLTTNAAEAIDREGTVTVTLGEEHGYAVISVTDTGCGISEEYQERHLFSPFRSTKQGGWGVGLYQTKQAVESQDGEILVESLEGRGTTFTVKLPLRSDVESDTPGERPMSDLPKLLIVEDDEAIRTQLKYALRDRYAPLVRREPRSRPWRSSRRRARTVVSLDLGLPPHAETAEEGLRTLWRISFARRPPTRVVVLTGSGDRANARRAIALGAVRLSGEVGRPGASTRWCSDASCYLQTLESENAQQLAETEANARFEEIIGSTPRMREIFSMVSLVAKTDVTVLVQGESGTGKELVARAVHGEEPTARTPRSSPSTAAPSPSRCWSPSCSATRRARTPGAHVQRKGKLELADGGTVFLDEIAEMPLPLQVKLLRFLQERKVERLGGRQAIPVDVRVIAASNKDLKDEIVAGGLREDLYFRLSVVTITLPPLRERAEDIGMLANAFLRRAGQEYRRKLRFSREALVAVAKYQWPGNIRELENSIQRASIMARGRFIEPVDLGIPSAGLPEHVSPARGAQSSRAAGRRRCPHQDAGQYQPGRHRAGREPAHAAQPAREARHRQPRVETRARYRVVVLGPRLSSILSRFSGGRTFVFASRVSHPPPGLTFTPTSEGPFD